VRAFLFVCVLFAGIGAAFGQQSDTAALAPSPVINAPKQPEPAPTELGPRKHSPTKATLLSMVIPGAGQVYNRKNWWWKVPIIYGGGAALVYGASFYNQNYQDFKTAYEFTVLNPGVPTGDPRYDQHEDPATLRAIRDSYREARDQCLVGLGLLYVLQVVDATVEAHFFEFNVSDNLSLNIQPQMMVTGVTPYTGLQFTMRFK
jgi:hypothetical protein